MLTLSREGDLTSESKGIVDSLRMTYDGMRLAAVHDYAAVPSVATSMDFRDGASADVEYTYDACGRLISDMNKGIASISYDAVGQPAFINAGDHAELSYYLPDGTKVRRTEAESDGRFLSQFKTTDYRNNAVYVDGDLHYLLTDSGLIGFAPLGAEYLHFVKDHLGNVRAVATSSGLVVQGNQYYPFGMSFATNKPVNELTEEHSYIDLNGNVIGGGDAGGFIPGGGAMSSGEGALIPQAALLLAEQPYRFGGKELYNSTGIYDFLARQYDPALCRFTTTDPLAAKYPSISPYAYCGNDPVNKFDPDGRDIYTIDSNGETKLHQNTSDKYDRVYVEWGEGPLNENAAHVRVNDRSILLSLANGNNPSGNCSRQDMKNLFMFAADSFDNQEWGLYYNKESYELTTKGAESEVGTSLDGVTWKVHSHPNVSANDRDEIESMGYWTYNNSVYDNDGKLLNRDAAWYPANSYPNDVSNYRNNRMPTSYVYFPNSGHVYRMTYPKLPYKTSIK